MIVLYILLAILVLLLMIMIHEFGHYVVGRALNFKITEFSIGFGKAIWQKTNKRGEKISLRIFPLGGFCSFFGEDTDGQDTNPDSFCNQKPWKRILVYISGAGFNFLSAVIFSFILLVTVGYGNVYAIDYVNPSFTQTYNEFSKGDIIYEINDEKINYVWDKTVETGNILIKEFTAEKHQAIDQNSKLVFDETGKPVYTTGTGLSMHLSSERLSFGQALLQCIPFSFGLAWMVLKAFWLLLTFQMPITAMGGTITTITYMANTLGQSFTSILIFLPLIAANLAVFNLLPVPALDGSHVVFTLIEWIRGKPINRNVEAWIHFVGLIVLLAFVVIVDIIHFFV